MTTTRMEGSRERPRGRAEGRGGKKIIFATGGTSGAQKYSPEEKEKEKEKEGRGRARLSGRKEMKDKIKKESWQD